MKRRSGVGIGLAIIVSIALWWLLRGGAPTSSAPGQAAERRDGVAMTSGAGRSDRSGQPRASISGTVTDEAKRPIAGAQVCTTATGPGLSSAIMRALACGSTDAQGRYRIADLVAGDYLVHASAKQFRPGAFHPARDMESHDFPLAAGEAKTGVDVELIAGGAEVTGIVVDVSGGPIAHAEIRDATRGSEHAGAAVESDEHGRFSLWLERGTARLDAIADGYAPAKQTGRAPGTFEIVLMPESSLAGTVVDGATERPVAGVQVEIEVARHETNPGAREITDAQGRFRLEHLSPGRYVLAARAEHGYGRSAGSLLVGLGQQVDGAVIALFPAHRVVGKVEIASSRKGCVDARVELIDRVHDRTVAMRSEPDGRRVADGVLAGTYEASVRCRGYAVRDDYAPIVVGERDVTGVVWEVDDGARLRGKVRTRSGAALDGVVVRARANSGARSSTVWSTARSRPDGSFELRGLRTGTHQITATSDRGAALREGFEVTVAPGATIERDIVLDDTGGLVGSVVDDAGHAVAGITVLVQGDASSEGATSDAGGGFSVDALRPGDYRVLAYRDAPRGAGEREKVKVTVRAGEAATVKLVVEAQRGAITGTVVDAANRSVPDAFLSWVREDSSIVTERSNVGMTREDWRGDVRPVLTAADGSFEIAGLAEGTYTLRAYRKGGGEATAEHVATGATARLQIKPTGSIAGVAHRAGGAAAPRDLAVAVEDAATGFKRSESFYMTGGRFTVTDLPAGHFDVIVEGDRSRKAITVDLRDGEARTGLDVELTPLVAVTGRVVEHGTQKPVPGYAIFISAARSEATATLGERTENVSDAAGRFTVRNAPVGDVVVRGYRNDPTAHDDATLNVVRTISGTGTVDIGDVGLLRMRAKRGDAIGVLGLSFERSGLAAPIDQRVYKISAIDPGGPAAGSGLQVGDVITTCDGVDVTGRGSPTWWVLVTAPPGTKLTFGTRRGFTATVVLARSTAVMP